MPLVTSQEMANDLGIPVKEIYLLAGKLSGFFPKGKYFKKGNRTEHMPSVYTLYQHHLLGRTLELAPGKDVEQKLQAIHDGFELPLQEKEMLYTPVNVTEQLTTFGDRINQMWETFTQTFTPAPRSLPVLSELPETFSNLTPDECRVEAAKTRTINPQQAYMLARRRDENQALDHYVSYLTAKNWESGTKVWGNGIIDEVSAFKPYLGDEYRGKGAAWRRFRSRLIGTGKLKAPAKGGAGYLIVA